MKFKLHTKARPGRHPGRTIITLLVILLIIGAAGGLVVRREYQANLRPVSTQAASQAITIKPGSTNAEIAQLLKSKQLIRSQWAFAWYLRSYQRGNQLKAGTYELSPNQNVQEIVDVLAGGKVATDLVTILPGKRLDQIKAGLIKAGFSAEAVTKALEPTQYQSHPALKDKPAAASLEGYLYPDSFQKVAETTPEDIIKLSLDEMDRNLTPDIRAGFSAQGLSVYQGITLASIVEQEVSNTADRPQVAQVFLKRKSINMQLGSDITAFYGAILADQEPNVAYDSPYNTRLHNGLPPGPVGNASLGSLQAVAAPANTDWLFFVAGDDGKTYFSKTNQEHDELVRKHCTKLCQ